MQEIASAILSGVATEDDFRNIAIPGTFRGAAVSAEDAGTFTGMSARDRDPRKSLRILDIPVPKLGPGEALVAVMASAINYNSVWASIFFPRPTFEFLKRYGRAWPPGVRHDLPYHVLGSDMSGVVLRTGPGVTAWKPGDEVVAHPMAFNLERPEGHDDGMLDPDQKAWGYETNFGALAELTLVKATQLMPKPRHLTWEEAAASTLVHSTAYRQLIGRNGAQMKQGDTVLIWGGAGGLGSYATQLVLAGGGTPVCVVSSPEKAALCRSLGAELIIDRHAEGFRFWTGEQSQDVREWRRFGERIRDLTGGDDVDIVFEHTGRETFGASVYVVRRGGVVVTCASTSGYVHEYDNRYLWMQLKRIIGTHSANYRESWESNRLICKGRIHPTLSKTFPLEGAAQATYEVHSNLHHGKLGVLGLAPSEGLGVTDPQLRERHLVAINRFRSTGA